MSKEKPLHKSQIAAILKNRGVFSRAILAGMYKVSEETIDSVINGTYTDPQPAPGSRQKISDTDAMLVIGAKGRLSPAQVATRFNIDTSTVHNLWSGDSFSHLERPANIEHHAKDWPLQILFMLLEGPKNPEQLSEGIGASLSTVHRGLRMLKANGFQVVRSSRRRDKEETYTVANVKLVD